MKNLKKTGNNTMSILNNNGTAKDALKQIEEKLNASPFATSGKDIIDIGVAFSNTNHNIYEWASKKIK